MNLDWATRGESWLLHSAVGGGLLLLFIGGLMRLQRQPARRQRLGEWGTLAALLLAVLSLGPAWLHVPVPRVVPPAKLADVGPSPVADWMPREPADDSAEALEAESPAPAGIFTFSEDPPGSERIPSTAAPLAAPEAATVTAAPGVTKCSIDFDSILFSLKLVYAAGAALLLARWLLAWLALARLLRQTESPPEAATILFAEMSAGMRPRPRLLVARGLPMPLSCGLFRPTVLLPAEWCVERSERVLRWTLAHELTHLRRRDAWSCVLFGLGQTLWFYLPWFWWLRRQVRLCQEYVADAAAAEQSAHVEDYAEFLLGLTPSPALGAIASGVFERSSDLLRRITMLLKAPERVEKACPWWWSPLAAAGLLSLAVLASGIGLRAEPAFLADDPVRKEEPKKEEPARREEPRKEEPKKDEPRREEPRKTPPLPDIDEALKKALENLPPADAERIREQIRKAMERAREAQRLLPPPAIAPLDNDAFRKHAEEARKRMEELQRQFQAQQEDLRKQFEKQQLELREKLGGVRLPEVNLGRRGEDRRLGAQVGTPEEVVSEQLNIPRGQGQVIASVHPDSAAAKAGLQPRDILLELNGKPVSSIPAEFAKMLDEIKSETPVDLVVLRKGKKENIKGLTLPEVKQEGRDRIQLNPGVGILRVRPGAEGVATTTTHNGDRFTTTHQEGGLNITIAGSIADGKAKATAIQILDGRTANKYEDVSQVPEQFREKVQLLLELSEKSTFKSERKKAAP